MLWQSSRRLGLLVILLGAAAIFFFTAAPDNTKPEKIIVGITNWNNTGQSFDVTVCLDESLADRAVRGDYMLVTTLHVTNARNDKTLADLGPQENLVVIDRASTAPCNDMVALVPQSIGWDRDGGTFEGRVDVFASTDLVRPDGKPVAHASGTWLGGTIPPPPTDD